MVQFGENVKVHFKHLGSQGFHYLFKHYLSFVSKHNEYYQTEP